MTTSEPRHALVPRRPEGKLLTLEAIAERAGLHPGMVERFVEFRLIEPVKDRDG